MSKVIHFKTVSATYSEFESQSWEVSLLVLLNLYFSGNVPRIGAGSKTDMGYTVYADVKSKDQRGRQPFKEIRPFSNSWMCLPEKTKSLNI